MPLFFFLILNTTMIKKTSSTSGRYSLLSFPSYKNYSKGLSVTLSLRSLENEMATHSSILAWKMPWTEEPGRLQSIGLQRVGHDWNDVAHSTWAPWGQGHAECHSLLEPGTAGFPQTLVDEWAKALTVNVSGLVISPPWGQHPSSEKWGALISLCS